MAIRDELLLDSVDELVELSLDELRMTFTEELDSTSLRLELPALSEVEIELEEFAAIWEELLVGKSSLTFGPEVLESEEHAKNPTLAAVTIIRDAANFLNIL